MGFDETEMKVCLKDNEVKHRFYYVEDWIQLDGAENEDGKDKRILRGCYFGKYVKMTNIIFIKSRSILRPFIAKRFVRDKVRLETSTI